MKNILNSNSEEISDLNGLAIPTIWIDQKFGNNELYE
jgi:hypothetical protein